MLQNARIVDWLTDGIERIALHHEIARCCQTNAN